MNLVKMSKNMAITHLLNRDTHLRELNEIFTETTDVGGIELPVMFRFHFSLAMQRVNCLNHCQVHCGGFQMCSLS